MDTFQNISITLPKERMHDNLFYSTSKNWSRDHSSGHDVTKDSFLRQVSFTANKKRTVNNYDIQAQKIWLEKKLNEKNELLIKQSKWKNYYLKEEICVLLEDILQHLQTFQNEVEGSEQVRTYKKKLQKVIQKVQTKRKAQKNWIQFLGLSPSPKLQIQKKQQLIQTQQIAKKSLGSIQKESNFSPEIRKLKEQNNCLLKNLNILTQQISIKQKEISCFQKKYSKQKQKKQKLKIELNSLKVQFQQMIAIKQCKKHDLQKTSNIPRKKQQRSQGHLYTHSWDKNLKSQNSKFGIRSQTNGIQIEEESQNFFTLSDTPFLIEKTKQIPISSGFIEARRKLHSYQKEFQCNKSRKTISVNTPKSGQKTASIAQMKSYKESQKYRKIKTQNPGVDSLQIEHGQLPTNSLICEEEQDEMDFYRQILLSQAITIENLLEKV